MSPLPERIAVLSELDDADDAVLYAPEPGGGFRLCPEVVTLQAEHKAFVAETERRIATAERQHRQLVVRGAVRAALVAAGADRGLLDGASALFGAQHELKVEGDLVLLDDPTSVSSVEFAVEAWLESPAGAPYRDRRRKQRASAGRITNALRLAAGALQ